MPLLGFQSRFAPLVESGEKRQTIRAYRKDGRDPKPGDRLYLWTGLRQPGARKLGEAVVQSVRKLNLEEKKGVGVFMWIDWILCDADETDELAQKDGFSGAEEMAQWFDKAHGLPFRGLLIEWGDIER